MLTFLLDFKVFLSVTIDNQGAESEYIERYKEYEAKKQEAIGNARKNNFSVTNPDNNTNY